MTLHRYDDDFNNSHFVEVDPYEDPKSISHKREVRKKIEERLEEKRLKQICQDDWDELNQEFDWDHIK